MIAPQFQLFSYSTPDVNVIDAKDSLTHQLAGEMVWNEWTGRVEGLDINPDYRIDGIADLLWAEAHRYAGDNDKTHPIHATP
jgi:hypothetical protein